MSKRTARALTAAERRRQAIELRIAGATYDQIAQTVGYASKSAAWKAVNKGIADIPREAANELRTMELERMDRLTRAAWTKALRGDVPSIRAVLEISRDRAKLLGLHPEPQQGPAHDVKVAFALAVGSTGVEVDPDDLEWGDDVTADTIGLD